MFFRIFTFLPLFRLILRVNRLELVPRGLGLLVSLQELDLSKNRLEELPDELADLKNLSDLNLEVCRPYCS
jgi:Leucine-rich repeat (LRR) protein